MRGSITILCLSACTAMDFAGAAAGNSQELVQLSRVRDLGYAWAKLPSDFRLHVRVPKPFSTADLAKNVSCNGIAMTGGYTQRWKSVPDGLVTIGGLEIAKDNGRTDGGILNIDGASVLLDRAGNPRQRLQSGRDQIYAQPILVFNGKTDGTFKKGKANRVALGRYKGGPLFMVMAFNTDRTGLSAVSLTQFVHDVFATAGGEIDWLLNFDGGPSAFLANKNGRTISPGIGVITSYICAERPHE